MSSTAIEKVNGTKLPETSHAESWARAGIADAEAEAIRARTAADVEARRIKAEAEAEAIKIRAAEEAEKQRLANERAALRFEREKAEQLAKIAEANRKREEAERLAAEADAQAAAEQEAAEAAAQEVEAADDRWRKYALGFYIVCAVVALPVQVAAFWHPDAWWLVVAPLMLEGGAWVVLKGAAAAVASHRPHWHYRLIAWLLAFIAAGINLWHGIHAFDIATAVGTAFASVAGPGVWDLHEHGRIRKRDGALTRSERRAKREAEKRAAAEKTAADRRAEAERQAQEKAAAEAARELAELREKEFPKVWTHARRLAAALGETTVTEPVWRRAHKDIEGVDPGDSVDIIRGRNVAERRVLAARSESPGSTPVKATSAQRANQMPRPQRGPARRPPIRRKGDTQPYTEAARKQAAITARATAVEESK